MENTKKKDVIEFSVLDLDKKFGDCDNYRLIDCDDKLMASLKISVNYPERESTYCVNLSGLVNGVVDIRRTRYFQKASEDEKVIFSIIKSFAKGIAQKDRWPLINEFVMKALREEIKSGNFSIYLAKHGIVPEERKLVFMANK